MQFNLLDIALFAVILVIALQFWRIRAISEQARKVLDNYCNKHNLQLISVARSKTRLIFHRAKLDWYTEFTFEFSSTGEERYQGLLVMRGLQSQKVDLPAHRIN